MNKPVKRRLHIRFVKRFGILFGQILSLYEAKSLGNYLAQIFSFIEGQYLAKRKIQIVKRNWMCRRRARNIPTMSNFDILFMEEIFFSQYLHYNFF